MFQPNAEELPSEELSSEKPRLVISFDDYFYWAKQPHKCKEIGEYLYEISLCHVEIILLTKNIELAKKTLSTIDYGIDRFCDKLKSYKDVSEKKEIIAKYILPYNSRSSSNRLSNSGSGIQKKSPLKLVIFDLDKELPKKTVNSACIMYLIDQKQEAHLEKLKEMLEKFKAHKKHFEIQQALQVSNKLSTNFAEMKIAYHYLRAESALIGVMYTFLKFTKKQLIVCQAFNKVLSNEHFISDKINSWNIYDCLVQSLSLTKPDVKWDIKEIKKNVLNYVAKFDASNDNGIKSKMGDDYGKFVQFLKLTDEELYKYTFEQEEGNYSWDQLEIDAQIICRLYKINIVVIHHIITKKIRTLINEKNVETSTEQNLVESACLLINENNITKIDPKKMQGTNNHTVYLGVSDERKIRDIDNKSTKTKTTNFLSKKFYTTILPARFLSSEMKSKLYPSDYHQCFAFISNKLGKVIEDTIADCQGTHLATLRLMPKFPKCVDGKYIWFNFNEGNNEKEELGRLKEHLFNCAKQQKVAIIEKIANFSNTIDHLESCIKELEIQIGPLDEKMFESGQKVAEAGSEYEKNNAAQEEKNSRPRFTLMRSADLRVVYDASAYSLPETIFSVCRRVARDNEPLANLIKAISDEKRRLGDKFNINDPERFISISDEQDDHHEPLNQSPDKKISKQKTYRNLLEIACFYGYFPLVEWLVKKAGADVNYEGNLLLLFHLMMNYQRGMDGDSPRILPFLIDCGLDPNKISKNPSHAAGGTFIHYVVELGSYLTVEYILQYAIHTNRGNTNIDIYKLSEPLPDKNTQGTPKTALLTAATHKHLTKMCDGKPGQHYKVLEQFFLLGVMFASSEIDFLANYHIANHEALLLIFRLINEIIQKYQKEANPTVLSTGPLVKHSSSGNIFANNKTKTPQLKAVSRWEVSKKEELECAMKLDDIWITKLHLKKTVLDRPKLERIDSISKLKNAALFLFSGSPRKSSAPEISQGSPRSLIATPESPPKKSSSEIISPRTRTGSLNFSANAGSPRAGSVVEKPVSAPNVATPTVNNSSPRERANSVVPALQMPQQEEISFEQLNHVDEKFGLAPIHIATIAGDMILFKYLQDNHVDLTLYSSYKCNIFYYAVKYKRQEIIEICKNAHIPLMPDKDKLTDTCKTPLHAAVENDDIDFTRDILNYALITKSSSCIRWHDDEGHPPIIKAIINENIAIMKIFLDKGIWATAKEIESALDPARISDKNKRERIYVAMIRAFQEHFAKLIPLPAFSLRP